MHAARGIIPLPKDNCFFMENHDIFAKCYTNAGYFGDLRVRDDRFFSRPVLPPAPATTITEGGKPFVMWSYNNYLGFANHPEVNAAARKALDDYGISSPMGSRMMSGTTAHHLALEKKLAQWQKTESAFVFNYGYLGVLGIVSSLAGPNDTVVMDKLSHACIVDAAFLSRAKVRIFKHNDCEDLERILTSVQRERTGGILILTEGVYGMTGDFARLADIIALKKKYNARLFVDDAHGVGILGDTGAGIGEHLGLAKDIDIYFGTYAKTFGAIGGFAAADKAIIDWIEYNSRTQVFAKALPMVYVKAVESALALIQGPEGDARRKQMWENSRLLSDGLKAQGFHIGSGESPIVSVYIPIGKDKPLASIAPQTVAFLREQGVFVSGIMYPVIPPGLVMYRMIPTALHTREEIRYTIEKFTAMRDALKLETAMTAEELKNLSKIYV